MQNHEKETTEVPTAKLHMSHRGPKLRTETGPKKNQVRHQKMRHHFCHNFCHHFCHHFFHPFFHPKASFLLCADGDHARGAGAIDGRRVDPRADAGRWKTTVRVCRSGALRTVGGRAR